MHLDEVEMSFSINYVHTQLGLLVAMVIMDPAPLGWGHSLPHQASLRSDLFSLLVNLGLCVFSHSKLQDDILHPMKLVQIIFHICYRVRRVTSVLCHHIEVDMCPDASNSTFERNCLRTSWLAKSHGENSQNTAPLISHLYPLPLRNLAVGVFVTGNPAYGGNAF